MHQLTKPAWSYSVTNGCRHSPRLFTVTHSVADRVHRPFPSLCPPAEWKAAFHLESCCILDELRCWMTRAGPEEDVLGLPLTYTTNPATKQ